MGFLQRFIMKEAGHLADKVLEKTVSNNSSSNTYNSGSYSSNSGSSNNNWNSSGSADSSRSNSGYEKININKSRLKYNDTASERDWDPLDTKIRQAVEEIEGCSIKGSISGDEFEQLMGCQIFVRGGCFAAPSDMMVISKNGEDVLYIRSWRDYTLYTRLANRKIRRYCEDKGIKILDFFEYLPNRYNYVKDRIEKTIDG